MWLPLVVAAALLPTVSAAKFGACEKHTLDFILLAGDANSAAIEDDIRQDLAKINITVNTRLLEKADFNKAMQDGDFHLCFTESWGPPYDPHSFATGWFRPDNEAHYPALAGPLEGGMTRGRLEQMVSDVLTVENVNQRQAKWKEILQEMHKQAISNPMWSRRMPAVINRRLSGYTHGEQQFDYPMHNIEVLSGSSSVKVSPGAQTGRFKSTGPMDPHSYRPNEFFISNWVYEGLVSYGAGGVIAPQLATSWTISKTNSGGEEYRFTLRSGVTFHDGSPFNCAAVKATFDHVLQPPLNTLNYHGWYHLPKNLQSATCDGNVFVAVMSAPYYPFLQELSLIRPLRILAPSCYNDGLGTDPVNHNSCPTKWDYPVKMDNSKSDVRCKSIKCSHGTGPWKFDSKVDNAAGDGTVDMAKFVKNANWWGGHKANGITEIVLNRHDSPDAVEAALLAGTVDMVVGGGVMTPAQVQELNAQHADRFDVTMGPPLLNTIVVMNAAKAPTSDVELRRVVMHAIDKSAIVEAEMAGAAKVADAMFPRDAPYCDVDLVPRWDYDLEKAKLLNCPAPVNIMSDAVAATSSDDDGVDTGLAVGLSLGIGIPLLLIVGIAMYCFGKKKGYDQLANTNKSGGQGQTYGNGSV